MIENLKCTVIIPAGGVGKRFGGQIPKQYIDLLDIPIIIRTIQIFDKIPLIHNIIISLNPEWFGFINDGVQKHRIQKIPVLVAGGKERQDSVLNCINLEQVKNADIILVHDAVRPCTTRDLVLNIIKSANEYGAAIPGLQARETTKLIDNEGFVKETISRTQLRNIQTPQGFKTGIFLRAYNDINSKQIFTDDASLVESLGLKVKIIEGEETNIKITNSNDIKVAESYIMNQTEKV